jgi:hypothetical protein
MPRWSAAQMLSRIALGKPLKLKEWPNAMESRILPAQLKLTEAIARQRISDVRGRRGPPGSKVRMPDDLFNDSEFTLLVTPHGTLTVYPPRKRREFEGKYGIDLDNWWREIDFDADEGEQAFSEPPVPCQGRPDRPHLRLLPGVLPARSGEAKAPARPPAHEGQSPSSTKPKQPASSKKTKKMKKKKKKTKNRSRRRGPKPGTVKRYASADRAQFDAIERLMRDEQLSLTAATQKLAESRRVAGTGIPTSRAQRLAKLYKAERLRVRKPHRQ